MDTIINNSLAISEDTFIFKLKYQNIFDTESLLKLINEIGKQTFNEKIEPAEKIKLIGTVFNLYSYTISSILSNFDNNDLYNIENLTDDYFLYLDRFRNIINYFIEENKLDLLEYDDEFGKLDL